MKINKNHQGKEFESGFRFVGQVKKYIKGYGDNTEVKPIYEERIVSNGEPMRFLQFNILTTKYNKLRVELNGLEQEYVYPYSSKAKSSTKVKWEDRFNKKKYPDDTYHLILPAWDLTKSFAEKINEDDWVEVKGRYEFDKMTNNDGEVYPTVKRIINSIKLLEEGEEAGEVQVFNERNNKYQSFEYICDFNDEKFKEINEVNLEIGIRSTYQDEETKNTKVNGVFLTYGKEKSVPKDVELIVYYKENPEGKMPLADAFTRLNPYDFLEVKCIDNNRPEFALVENEIKEVEDNPFANINDSEKVVTRKWAISGNKKGLEVVGIDIGSWQKELLTEEEIAVDDDDFLKGDQAEVINEADDMPWLD